MQKEIEKSTYEYYYQLFVRAIISIFAYLILSIIVPRICYFLFISKGELLASALANFFTYLSIALLIFILYFKFIKNDIRGAFKGIFLKVILGALALYMGAYLMNVYTVIVEELDSYVAFIFNESTIATVSANQENINALLTDKSTMFLMFASAAIFGPFVEEMIFRRAMFDLIKKEEIAFIVSLLFFTLIHVTSSLGLVSTLSFILITMQYLVSSFILTYIYTHYHNIYINILVHIIYNSVIMIPTILLNI